MSYCFSSPEKGLEQAVGDVFLMSPDKRLARVSSVHSVNRWVAVAQLISMKWVMNRFEFVFLPCFLQEPQWTFYRNLKILKGDYSPLVKDVFSVPVSNKMQRAILFCRRISSNLTNFSTNSNLIPVEHVVRIPSAACLARLKVKNKSKIVMVECSFANILNYLTLLSFL